MTSDERDRKAAHRSRLRAARRGAPAAPMVSQVLLATAAFGVRPGQVVCAYLAVGGEPGSAQMLESLRGAGYRVLLPVVVGDAPLDWAEHTGELRPGPYGLREPVGPPLGASAVASAALVLVPALAVDRSGVRLGKGGGHYDRSLPLTSAPLVAVVRDDEFVDSLPSEPHDVRVDAVLTPSRGLIRLPCGVDL
ncbi:5-formyltetrahydrofolate cyclo-ligase [Saccharothrix coeruleofusca]|uniref:5-formyltetrahydrofolate cyclo-ligase n=1 Tax=Saccharothrix coeruleofusca TaxID=33919 RepID=A0A918AGI6_9PSEU|nr:5-formyltetrahydrofolate cyclo-ligase [Saccharothrix coeruleofusca]MBP2340726.1 5-formyltetrahydrofolate cyclo-ligase [Saccharothrix coeruleofusca]GGP33763.1 5-formyltetrahydrofolate cyclo-ligase [Saccharothrix coeruleofusca]